MFLRYKSEGIFLAKSPKGERDELFSVYTKDFGKVSLVVKSVREIKSKLRGGADLFYLAEIHFIEGKGGKKLIESIVFNSFKGIRKDLLKVRVASKIGETVNELVQSEEKDKEIYRLLKNIFFFLDRASLSSLRIILLYYYFLFNLLSISGYRIELYRCVSCGKKIKEGEMHFSSKGGGIVCSGCRKNEKLKLEKDVVKILRLIFDRKLKTLMKLKIEEKHIISLKNISCSHVSFIF